jgi:YHS domain-containing protein/thiol-disulfide isomerase/thioredoxin
MRASRFAIPMCLLLVLGSRQTLQATELSPATVWMTDFAKAQAEAVKLHRPLVAHFHTKWCPPCRKMEKEILHTPQVLKQLDDGFVAVKVDLENPANSKYQQQYHVSSMPTDLLLTHDGKVLSRSEGYTGAEDRKKYLAALSLADSRYSKEGKRLARGEAHDNAAPATAATTRETTTPRNETAVASTTAGPVNKLVPEPMEPKRLDEETIGSEAIPAAVPESAQGALAMDGYCAVTLRATRSWKPGQKQFSLEHDGQTFLFLAADQRDEFKANPVRFAPRLLGCDPVVLAESDLAVRGSTKFGAYYEGELFLFESTETRARFKKEPARYVRLKHVLKPEDVKDMRKLASSAPAK